MVETCHLLPMIEAFAHGTAQRDGRARRKLLGSDCRRGDMPHTKHTTKEHFRLSQTQLEPDSYVQRTTIEKALLNS